MDSAVVESKLGAAAVTTVKINNSAVTTEKINDEAVTSAKFDPNIVLPFNATLDESLSLASLNVNSDPKSLVTKGFLNSNLHLYPPPGYFHIDDTNVTVDASNNKSYVVGTYYKYIVETYAEIFLPPITNDGMYFSVTNKCGQPIVVSTDANSVLMYSWTVAPDGDNAFEVDNHRTLDVVSQITSLDGGSWQARFF